VPLCSVCQPHKALGDLLKAWSVYQNTRSFHNPEFIIVVSGRGLIQMRKIGSDEVMNFEVSGDKIEAVHMLPGYTHNIINLSDTQDLVTVMWANEQFNSNKPDTFFEIVEEK